MNNNINIAELLKDCPKGMELYSPLCGECVFDRLNMGTIICKKQNTQEIAFTSKGYYMLPVFDNCECMIFPSKEQRDWSKFCPFKDGDVLRDDSSVFIFKSRMFDKGLNCYVYNTPCILVPNKRLYVNPSGFNHGAGNVSFATEEEKQELFQAIKDNGYRLNADTKTLEMEEKTNKFDITTLKPFESKVLARDDDEEKWRPGIWGFYDNGACFPYKLIGDVNHYCIPYEGNQHLLGTTDDCDEYYKTW